MKKILFIAVVILMSCKQSVSQVSKAGVSYILKNTSFTQQFLILFKDSKKTDRIIWSNYLLEYYTKKGFTKKKAIETVLQKIIKNDTFHIDKTEYRSLCASPNKDTIKSLVVRKKSSLATYLTQYFFNDEMRPEYLRYRWEIAKLLWDKSNFLYINSEQLNPIPRVLTLRNKNVYSFNSKRNSKKPQNDSISGLTIFFYFPKYDFFIDARTNDTNCLYNIVRKRTDQEVLNSERYVGAVECLKISFDRENKSFFISMFDKNENFLGKEFYHYDNKPIIKEETIYYNLSGETKKVKRKVIIPLQRI